MQRIFWSVAVFMLVLAGWAPRLVAQQPTASTPGDLPAVQDEFPPDEAELVTGEQVHSAPVTFGATGIPAALGSLEETIEKIRRASLTGRYDEVIQLGEQALSQWPENRQIKFYYEHAMIRQRHVGAQSERETKFSQMREQRREERLRALMSEVGQTGPQAVPQALEADPATPADQPAQLVADLPLDSPEEVEVALPPPSRAQGSLLDRAKELSEQPAVRYGGGALLLLIVVGVFVARRRRGSAEAKPAAGKAGKKSGKAAVVVEEPEDSMAPMNEMDDSMFGDPLAVAAAEPIAEPRPSRDTKLKPEPEPASDEEDLSGFFGAMDVADDSTEMAPKPAPAPAEDSRSAFDALDELFGGGESAPAAPPAKPEPKPAAPAAVDDPFAALFGSPEAAETQVSPQADTTDIPAVDETFSFDSPQAEETLDLPVFDFDSAPAGTPEPATDADQVFGASDLDLPQIRLDEETIATPEPLGEPAEKNKPSDSSDIDLIFAPITPEELDLTPPPQPAPDSTGPINFDIPSPDEPAEPMVFDLPEADQEGEDDTQTAHGSGDTGSNGRGSDSTVVSLMDQLPPFEEQEAGEPGEDLFNREFRLGMDEFRRENWSGAVHHLAIAAALRPGSEEIKEQLREARRLRKSEQEG